MSMSMSDMIMATSTSAMSATATSSTTSTSSMSTAMSMSEMLMTFFTSTSTPLYSSTWTPLSAGQYAGTCIFLILLSFLLRMLIAVRIHFDTIWGSWAARRGPDIYLRPEEKRVQRASRRPWRINEAVMRACLDTLVAGVGYLLMIAVMTMNTGYFLSVLAGVFLGSFVLGGFTGDGASVH